jgi:hypothetical protein
MRVIVCGDRKWRDPAPIFRELDGLVVATGDDLELIEGCAHGADELAGNHPPARHDHGFFSGGWAWLRHRPATHVPADWEHLGRRAGPMRNRSMLARNPDLVLAFHANIRESRGTADMIRAARAAGVEVRLYQR